MPPADPPRRLRGWGNSIYLFTLLAALGPVLLVALLYGVISSSAKQKFVDRAAQAVLCAETEHVQSYVVALVSARQERSINLADANKSITDLSPGSKWTINVGKLQFSTLADANAGEYYDIQRRSAIDNEMVENRVYPIKEAGGILLQACSVTSPLTTENYRQYRKAVYTIAWQDSRYSDLQKDIRDAADASFDALTWVILSLLVFVGMFAAAANFIIVGGTLRRLRGEVELIRDGQSRQIGGTYPRELTGLQTLLNGTIAAHERAITRTRELVNKIAHDLNNRLQILVGAANAETIDRLAIRRAVAHMRDLIERYRQLQGSIGEQTPWARSEVRIVEFVSDIVNLQRFDLQNRNIRYQVNVRSGAPGADDIAIHLNKTDIEIILSNLLSNAAKYGRGEVEVDIRWNDSHVAIEIADNGPGIPQEKRDMIFNDGYRLEVDVERPGTGFGLGIVRFIAELNLGVVSVSPSRLGGACFTLQLPRKAGIAS
ncbi:hypothetical protein IP88_14345 [alpha proteobacterium AAP81b]|nr:hypothetical protein IP88_14345 [alpha proteobacterium AAP81b]